MEKFTNTYSISEYMKNHSNEELKNIITKADRRISVGVVWGTINK